MKNAIITIVIACAVAVLVPRDLREAATLTVRAGVSLIELGLALYPQGYDAGYERDDGPPTELTDA